MMPLAIRRVLAPMLVVCAVFGAPASAQGKPEDLVAAAITVLGAAIKTEEAALAGERALPTAIGIIEQAVAPHMDFAGITREAVGNHWARATAAQRGDLEREFRQLLVHVLARLLVTNKGDVLEALPTTAPPSAKQALVRVMATRQRGAGTQTLEAMQVTLRRTDSEWKVFELRADGVDLVRLYSNNFAVVIERAGDIDGLIQALAQRNALNAGSAAPKPRAAAQ